MYSADFLCTYKMMECDEDKEHLYRIQLLQAFNIDHWDDTLVEEMMNDLYVKIKDNEQFRFILDAAKGSPKLGMMLSLMEEDKNKLDSFMFIMLFNYDFFDLFHNCICQHMTEQRIRRDAFEAIMKQF